MAATTKTTTTTATATETTATAIVIGNYGEIPLDGLNVLAVGSFKGNIWAGDGSTRVALVLFFDESK